MTPEPNYDQIEEDSGQPVGPRAAQPPPPGPERSPFPPSPYIAIKPDKSPLISKGVRWEDWSTVPWLTMAEVMQRHENDQPIGVNPAALTWAGMSLVHIDIDRDKESGEYKVGVMPVVQVLTRHDVAHEIIDSFSGKAKHILVAWEGDNLGRPAWHLAPPDETEKKHGGELIHSGGYAAIGDLERYREAVQRLKDKIKAGDGGPMSQAVVDAFAREGAHRRPSRGKTGQNNTFSAAEVIEMLGFVLEKDSPDDRYGRNPIWMAAHEASRGHADVRDWLADRLNFKLGEASRQEFYGEWDAHTPRADGYTAGTLVKLARDAGMPRKNNLKQQALAIFMHGANLSSKKIKDLTQNALAAGIPLPEINRTLQEAFEKARTELDGAYFEISRETLAEILDMLDLQVRLNKRHGNRREYLQRDKTKWEAAEDTFEADLICLIRERFHVKAFDQGGNIKGTKKYKISREDFRLFISAISHHFIVDPFLEWIKSLPPWDRQPRLYGLIKNLFGTTSPELAAWAAKYIFVGSIQRAIKPGAKLDEAPVLIGRQGIGKSYFCQAIFPEDMQQEWWGDALTAHLDDKQVAEATRGIVLAEMAEMDGLNHPRYRSRVKAMVTRTNDGQARQAYKENVMELPRRFVIVGTTNEESILPNDPAGNRRFVAVDLVTSPNPRDVKGAIDKFMRAEREQLWAEAYHRQQAGEGAHLPYDLKHIADAAAEAHRTSDSIEDDIAKLPPAQQTVNDIANDIEVPSPPDKRMQRRITDALTHLGWIKLPRQRRDRQRVILWQHPDFQTKKLKKLM